MALPRAAGRPLGTLTTRSLTCNSCSNVPRYCTSRHSEHGSRGSQAFVVTAPTPIWQMACAGHHSQMCNSRPKIRNTNRNCGSGRHRLLVTRHPFRRDRFAMCLGELPGKWGSRISCRSLASCLSTVFPMGTSFRIAKSVSTHRQPRGRLPGEYRHKRSFGPRVCCPCPH